jgi:streptogramin lyase
MLRPRHGNGRDQLRAHRERASTRPRGRRLLFLIGVVVVLALPASAAAIDEFPVPTGGNPSGITSGPDGALWFTQEGSSEIGRMTTTGVVTNEFFIQPTAPPSAVPALDQIVTGPDGRLWFTMPRDNAIGAITTGGAFTRYPLPGIQPEGITVGPDGNLWFTDFFNQVGRITTGGAHTMYGPTGIGPSDITTGPDGRLWFTEQGSGRVGALATNAAPAPNTAFSHVGPTGAEPSGITHVPGSGLWFTESGANQIGHINLAGGLIEYPGTGLGPSAIAAGRDGALWFTESEANSVGRITTGGIITNHFPLATPASQPSDMTAGPDGALWFTELLGNKIGRIDTAPVFVPPPPAPVALVPKRKSTKRRCKVPKVKRLSVAKAKKKLKRARCKYRVRGRGFVVSTVPKAGKRTTKRVLVKAKPKRRNSTRTARTATAGTIR